MNNVYVIDVARFCRESAAAKQGKIYLKEKQRHLTEELKKMAKGRTGTVQDADEPTMGELMIERQYQAESRNVEQVIRNVLTTTARLWAEKIPAAC